MIDTGIGIPGEEHEAIFEVFHRCQTPMQQASQGTGLGLSIANSWWNNMEAGSGSRVSPIREVNSI